MSKYFAVRTAEVPPNVMRIADNRMADFIAFELGRALILGVVDLKSLAASAYLQGFCDCYDARSPGCTP